MRVFVVTLLVGLFYLVGCTTTQKGAGLGTLIGAGTGAIIGHQSGDTGKGALIGAAAGAAGGALLGEMSAVKFCPTCGADYTSDVVYCPVDGTELQFKGARPPQPGTGGTQ